MSFYWGKTCHVSIKKHQGNAGNYTEDLFASTKTKQLFKKVGIKSRIQKSWGQTNNNCRCIFQIQHIVTQTWQNLCIHKTPCYDFLKRITSVLREKLCLTIARDFTLPFEDVINCILWDIRVSAPGWASYDSIIKDSDTVFSSPVFFWVI